MRVAVIGAGSIGRRHIGNLLSLGCEVQVMDPSEAARERVASEYRVPVDSVVRFDTNPDALVICAPYDKHLMWVEEAIRRRMAMFIEKPLGSLEQLPRWREIAAMELPINQVGYMLRFHQDVAYLKEQSPEWGELWLRWDASRYGYRLEESSHEIDLALYFGADPATLRVDYGRDRIDFGNEWEVRINDHASRYWRQWVAGRTRSHGSRESKVVFTDPSGLGDAMYHEELRYFVVQAWRQQPSDGCGATLAEGLRVLEVCHQVEQMTGQPA